MMDRDTSGAKNSITAGHPSRSFSELVRNSIPKDWEIFKDDEVSSAKTGWYRRNRIDIRTSYEIPEAAVAGVVRFTYCSAGAAAGDLSRRIELTTPYVLRGIPRFLNHEPLTISLGQINRIPVTTLTTTIWVFPGLAIKAGALIAQFENVIDVIHGNFEDTERLAPAVIGTHCTANA
jgi:hypothetical protein